MTMVNYNIHVGNLKMEIFVIQTFFSMLTFKCL